MNAATTSAATPAGITTSEYHAIADDALDASPLDVDQYFITLQRLDIWQDPEATHPEYCTLELTLELKRQPSPAKPRIEDWLSENLPGWTMVEWAMAEPCDDDEWF